MTAAIPPIPMVVEQDDLRFAALKRLQASRIHLQAALIPQRRSSGAPGESRRDTNDWSSTARAAWHFIRSRDAAGLLQSVTGLLGHWWAGHPWQPTISLLGQTVDAEVTPWVRKHPVSAIALGLCAGAAIAWTRPWRWRAVHGQARSLQRSASHWLMRELTSPAMQMLIATSVAAWLGKRNGKPSGESGPSGGPVNPAASDT